jgi:hypothetical protein
MRASRPTWYSCLARLCLSSTIRTVARLSVIVMAFSALALLCLRLQYANLDSTVAWASLELRRTANCGVPTLPFTQTIFALQRYSDFYVHENIE